MANKKRKSHKGPSKRKSKPGQPTFQDSNIARIPKPQRHHFIPRWVLRGFSRNEGPTLEKGQESINCYYPETGQLITLEISLAYSAEDLYKDTTNPVDTSGYGVEQELSVLEGHASNTVRRIITAARANTTANPIPFTMTRNHLSTLRKFLFVMHYHSLPISTTYFQEDHPDNAKSSAWIRAYRERHNLSPSEVWIHVLRYYLDTSHNDLLLHGTEADQAITQAAFRDQHDPRYAGKTLEQLLDRDIDPALENWKALAYSLQIREYYLAIWEAAPGSEFIISSNSFGIWEGVQPPIEALHRFYVVSPRIVLVFCSTVFKPGSLLQTMMMMKGSQPVSMVLDVPHAPPKVRYAKSGSLGEKDVFEYEIQRLNEDQTNVVNALMLAHVGGTKEDMVTFSGEKAMVKTLEAYEDNWNFRYHKQGKYEALARRLREIGTEGVPGSVSQGSSECLELYEIGPAPGGLWEFNMDLYDLLHLSRDTDPQSVPFLNNEKRIIAKAAKVFAKYISPNKNPPVVGSPRPARLVRTMDDSAALTLFFRISMILTVAGVRAAGVETFMEQYIIGVLDWLLKNNRRCFDELENEQPVYRHWLCDIKEYTNIRHLDSSDPISHAYLNSRSTIPGTFYRSHLNLYHLLCKDPTKTPDDFDHHLYSAIISLVTNVPNSNLPARLRRSVPSRPTAPTRPASLVQDMTDEQALRVFAYVRYMLESCEVEIRDGTVFKEQVVIGVLRWMVDQWRDVLDQVGVCVQMRDGGGIVEVYEEFDVDVSNDEVELEKGDGGVMVDVGDDGDGDEEADGGGDEAVYGEEKGGGGAMVDDGDDEDGDEGGDETVYGEENEVELAKGNGGVMVDVGDDKDGDEVKLEEGDRGVMLDVGDDEDEDEEADEGGDEAVYGEENEEDDHSIADSIDDTIPVSASTGADTFLYLFLLVGTYIAWRMLS